MKRICLLAVVLVFLGCASNAMAQGTVQITGSGDAAIHLITIAWTGAAAGGTVHTQTFEMSGLVDHVVTNPGTTAPTDNYDIVLNDKNGYDIMGGMLANRDTANTESAIPLLMTDGAGQKTYGPIAVNGTYTFSLSGTTVNSATGTVDIYILP